ncbi:hypothetical protein PoB_004868500 [Plakobranchus ocellatus]|uniref:Uncharacterized protein n=1 Tax=Plakobranchus ocellatus TaxID=259542 RepID=A0AAV4BNP8_9GAST|nr:hypothetical protein PoB_004868500 [Plakobranchus ocellatus]
MFGNHHHMCPNTISELFRHPPQLHQYPHIPDICGTIVSRLTLRPTGTFPSRSSAHNQSSDITLKWWTCIPPINQSNQIGPLTVAESLRSP